ncbi:ATP-binding protein [Candidatus Phytoplasma ziziphi]|nr:DUF234 domain-containing protein [Candidatus Phytoplasma ziziphi]
MEQMDNYNQALFGRVTYKKKIKPFSYLEASLFYPNANYKDKIRFYSVFGGLPLYLNKIDKNKSIKENIMKICIPNIDSIENEIYTNLMQEIRLPAPYLNILDVMSDKKEIKLSKISQKIEENTSKTSYYLKKMSNLEIIDKNICFGEKENLKKTFYHIKDQFLKFYYRFIKQYYRHQYMYDNKEDFYNKTIEPFLEIFISWEFEKICKDFLIYKYRGETSRFILQRKNINIEIDLLCRTKEGIKAFECKWGPEINNEHIYALKNKIEQITNIHPIHQIGFFAKKKPLSNICQNCLYFEPKNLFE